MQKDLFIYLPGLGSDKMLQAQTNILNRWQDKNTAVKILQPNWHSDKQELYLNKKLRLENEIKKLTGKFRSTCIFGSSAGGSMALNIFESLEENLTSCILVSSKLRNPQYIGEQYRQRAPALFNCVKASEKIANAPARQASQRIQTIRPLFDETVPTKDMTVKGARNRIIPLVGHSLGIGYCLLVKKKTFSKWNNKFKSA